MASTARIEELRKKFDENPRRYFAPLANEYRKAGELDQAISLCRTHLPQQPGHISGHIVLAQALFEARDVDTARDTFTSALELDPENLIALRYLGDICREQGDLAGARAWYNRVLEVDPRNDEITLLLRRLDSDPSAAAGARRPVAGAFDAAPTAHAAPPIPHGNGREATPVSDFSLSRHDSGVSLDPFAAHAAGEAVTPAASSAPTEEPTEIGEPEEASPLTTASASAESLAYASFDDFTDFQSGVDFGELERTGTASEDDWALGFGSPTGLEDSTDDDASSLTPSASATAPQTAESAADPDTTQVYFGVSSEEMATTSHVEHTATTSSSEEPTVSVDDLAYRSDAAAEPPTAFVGSEEELEYAASTMGTSDSAITRSVDGAPTDEDADPLLGRMPELAPQDAGETPASFVTETMAELYLQQGFRSEALGIYRELLAQNPSDANLRERVEQLESGSLTSVSMAALSEDVIEKARKRGATAAKRTVRAFFGTLAGRRIARRGTWGTSDQYATPPRGADGQEEAVADGSDDRGDGDEHYARASVPQHDSAAPESARSPSVQPAWEHGAAQGKRHQHMATPPAHDALARLFPDESVAGNDERAAARLASAYDLSASDAATGGGGRPSRVASNELSLDNVFRDERSPASPQTQSGPPGFSFDQFFADSSSGTEPAPDATSAPSIGTQPARSANDIEQFTAWLEGLKKK